MKSQLTILLVAALALGCVPKETSSNEERDAQKAKVDSFIEKALARAQVVPGLSVAVTDSLGVLLADGYGYANIEDSISVNSITNFYIASTTKSFVGLLGVILDEEKNILLDDPVTKYKPFSDFEDNKVFEDVTVRNLLSHTTGLDNGFLSFRLAYSGAYTREEILRTTELKTFKKEVGKKFEYTNLGYYFYSLILKEELNKSWQDLVQERVFAPLGMENASAYISRTESDQLAYPYHGVDGKPVKSHTLKIDATMHAAGGLMMNAEDVAKFMSFYLSKGMLSNKQIYAKEIVEASYAKQAESTDIPIFNAHGYGLGWLIGEVQEKPFINHLGGYIGYKASISIFPEDNLGVAVFTNHNEMGRTVGHKVSEYIFELYFGDPSTLDETEARLLKEIEEALERAKIRAGEDDEEWGKPNWNLTMPKSDYTGQYYNELDGMIDISLIDGNLKISSGSLSCIAEPHSEADCLQVELIDTARKIIRFKMEKGKIVGLDFREKVWEKIQ